MVKTPACHAGDNGFDPRRGRQVWGISSVGRATALHAVGHRFDPGILHQTSVSAKGTTRQSCRKVSQRSPLLIICTGGEMGTLGSAKPPRVGSIPTLCSNNNAAFVYRLVRWPFKPERGVQLPYAAPRIGMTCSPHLTSIEHNKRHPLSRSSSSTNHTWDPSI